MFSRKIDRKNIHTTLFPTIEEITRENTAKTFFQTSRCKVRIFQSSLHDLSAIRFKTCATVCDLTRFWGILQGTDQK